MQRILLPLFLVFAFTGCTKSRTPCVYDIPEGFTGWVLIEFERSDCPAIPKPDGKLVFSIGKDGRVCTSSKMEVGWANDEYYYVGTSRRKLPATAPGVGGMVWGAGTGSSQTMSQKPRVYETFFIGTEQQFNSAPKHPEL
jgi:uncharacterized protein DUF6843